MLPTLLKPFLGGAERWIVTIASARNRALTLPFPARTAAAAVPRARVVQIHGRGSARRRHPTNGRQARGPSAGASCGGSTS
eukprot:5270118-Alexandrium_andersonii.AAC.1